ncbi:hypothetical protein FSARC_13322 [Fusarium sarcochroum]|uniref:Protein kinase domain-containing protein n=1 Tax=Fusarium sarcochroum TaxID=1208366 RepID=A0A8H4T2H5_9HYPO|nr:hypothetical protein FSARC_13322 [Fusarium sarcochroum]
MFNFIYGKSIPPSEVDREKLANFRKTVRHSLVRSAISKDKFLPADEVSKLVTTAKVNALLPQANKTLVEFICKRAKKLFLTASWQRRDLQPLMEAFQKSGMTDEKLPICDLTSEDESCKVHAEENQKACSHEKALDAFHSWDGHDVSNFYRDQWIFCVPVFDMGNSTQVLNARYILPFTGKSDAQKDGHFSTVFEAEIHPSHQTRRQSSRSKKPQTHVALKELKDLREPNYDVETSWRNEANALFQISGLRHKHLISQATAFKHGEKRFIMLEWADGGTLRDVWKREPKDRFTLDADKVMTVLEQLAGLAGALSRLHGTNTRTKTAMVTSNTNRNVRSGTSSRSKTIFSPAPKGSDTKHLSVPRIRFEGISSDDENYSSDNPDDVREEHWRHGDLKPDNILEFNDSSSTWLGTLKVADLGLAKQHVFATTRRDEQTQQKYTTSHYEAPEVITNRNLRLPRSRRYDIWSMGCIIFEFTVWLLYGYEDGLEKFYKEAKDIDAHRETLYFTSDLTGAKAQVSEAAQRWMKHILEVDPECNRPTPSVIRDLIELVRDRLLVVDLPKDRMNDEAIKRCRATADELEAKLSNIQRSAADDEQRKGNYLFSGGSRAGALPPRSYQGRKSSFLSTSSGSNSRPSNLDVALTKGLLTPNDLLAFYSTPHLDRELTNSSEEIRKILKLTWNDVIPEATRLCAECQKIDIWTHVPVMKETLATIGSKAGECDFHKLILRCLSSRHYNDPGMVNIRKSGSTLIVSGMKTPLLSLCKVPETATSSVSEGRYSDDVQIGLPGLLSVNSTPFYDLLLNWLNDCDLNHPQCGQVNRSSVKVPTRLIDVGQGDAGSSIVYLHETGKETSYRSNKLRYIALSHPWGDAKEHRHFCTTSENLQDRLDHGIVVGQFPNTFKHAIEVTRQLGVQYLWIDSLCIIQGHGGDFDTEAKKMEAVFSSAYCVIAASRASGTSSGFLWERPTREMVKLDSGLPEDTVYACEAIDDFQHDVIEGALNKRGWVLQERALAPRTIYFTEKQTYWECGQGVRCETLTRLTNNQAAFLGDANFPKLAMRSARGAKIRFYQSLYEQYSNLQFTRIYDRPIAIAGLEQRLVSAFKTDGGYGVFKGSFFGRSLLWKRDTTRSSALTMIAFPKNQKFRVPTWSWMAYEGPIAYLEIPFGCVEWDYETAEGRIQSPWVTRDAQTTSASWHTGDSNGKIDLTAEARDLFDLSLAETRGKIVYDDGTSLDTDQSVRCVVVGSEKMTTETCDVGDLEHYVLLVKPVQGPGDNCYRRIGIGTLLGRWIEWDRPGLRIKRKHDLN